MYHVVLFSYFWLPWVLGDPRGLFSLVSVSHGYPLVAVYGLLTVVASHTAERGF